MVKISNFVYDLDKRTFDFAHTKKLILHPPIFRKQCILHCKQRLHNLPKTTAIYTFRAGFTVLARELYFS